MFALAFVWYKVFYWMRLFKDPAFFMNLLTRTLGDIVPFMLMISILIMMFSNVIYILNLIYQSATDEEEAWYQSQVEKSQGQPGEFEKQGPEKSRNTNREQYCL